MNAELNIHTTAAGRFLIEAFRIDADGIEVPGSRRVAAEWFPNLITDNGLNRMGRNSDYLGNCMVGSGSAAPANTDTSLQSLVASTATIQADTNGNNASPRYGWRRKTFRFGTGVAAGNLSEVGVGYTTTAVFSRALILDGGGSPTTITVLADEVLDVTYELRFYISEADVAFNVDISGVTYACVVRPASITEGIGTQVGDAITVNASGRANGIKAYETQVLGAVGSEPSGTAYDVGYTNSAYTAGTFYRNTVASASLNQANTPTGIGAMRIDNTFCDWQVSFTPKIPKDATKVLTLNVRSSWARHV
ncbi:hypothetical protein [Xanthomonas phage Olaya]|nr:hypothetical protein [Xanthomonas phage Olaya]QTZ82474.1 hypothetical protein [Xanthomonas phage Bolivar]QTZ82481.1 hypothetical protein [Xanthomonas phage Usaquen]QTZ82588.1 hypothetical protein [Xanthomonas phage Alcala]QTZ82641.1 hypothetical protein [Xanthomonas phage Fontebon]QTZ82681.1 hypothetical protein [Xanthomonas phage Soumapaz]CAA2366773.1 Phage protein [Xylella phage Usme]